MEYPVNLRMTGRACTVVGGGAVAERKVAALLQAGALVTVIAPELTHPLREMSLQGRISWMQKQYEPGDLAGSFLVVCATDSRSVNRSAAAEAKQVRALTNVVDSPELCDFTVPSQLARGDLLITVSTGGHSPAFTRRLKEELDTLYGPEYGDFLTIVSQAREQVKQRLTSSRERERFWRKLLDAELIALIRAGRINEAEERVRDAISRIGTQP